MIVVVVGLSYVSLNGQRRRHVSREIRVTNPETHGRVTATTGVVIRNESKADAIAIFSVRTPESAASHRRNKKRDGSRWTPSARSDGSREEVPLCSLQREGHENV